MQLELNQERIQILLYAMKQVKRVPGLEEDAEQFITDFDLFLSLLEPMEQELRSMANVTIPQCQSEQ